MRPGFTISLTAALLTTLDKTAAPPTLAFSPDGRRVAYASASNSVQLSIIVDGVPGEMYDEMAAEGVVFIPDGKRVADRAIRGSMTFMEMRGYEQLCQLAIDFRSGLYLHFDSGGALFTVGIKGDRVYRIGVDSAPRD